jgi:WD40 repeat protein
MIGDKDSLIDMGPAACPDCGKAMPASGTAGLCPACLARMFFGAEGAEPTSMSEPVRESGDVIGRYTLIEPIGEGGFGIVYRAEQTLPFRRHVALKLIKPGLDSRMVVARFEAERQALSMLDHPNIARVLDAGTTADGHPYFVMDLVEGLPVTHFCTQNRLELDERLRLFLDICAGMEHAHAKGVIHRDLKPSNVMVASGDEDGRPKVTIIDFGIAKALWQELTPHALYTSPRQMMGTPEYMSPEQAIHGGLDIDTRADVYSLGALLYEMLTGRPPLIDDDLTEAGLEGWMRAIREAAPMRPSRRLALLGPEAADLPLLTSRTENELDWVVLKALSKERERRYQTVRELGADIRRFLDHEAVSARPPSLLYLSQKFVRRHRAQVVLAGVAVAVLVVGSLVSLGLAIRAEQAETRTRQAFSLADATAAYEKVETQRYGEAVALLCRSLRMDEGNREAAFRLLTLLAEAPVGVMAAPVLHHNESVWQGRFLPPEGRQIVTASMRNGMVTLWDWQSGAVMPVRHFTTGDPITAFTTSMDGRWVATGSISEKGCQASVWSIAEGLPRGGALPLMRGKREQNRAGVEVTALAFSPDGALLYTATSDRHLRAWNVEDSTLRWEIAAASIPRCLAASSDGSRVAAGYDDTRLALYEATTGAVVRDAPVQRHRVEGIQFSRDGKKLLVTGGDTFSAVLDAQTGQKHGDLQHFDRMHALAVDPQSERVATGGEDFYVRLRTLKGVFIRSERVPDVVRKLAFSEDSQKLAVGTQEPHAVLSLLDGRTGVRLGAPLQMHRVVSDLSFHPGNEHMLVTCHSEDTAIIDIRPRQLKSRSLSIGERIQHGGFLSDGRGVYALTDSGKLVCCDLQGVKTQAPLFDLGQKPSAFAFEDRWGVALAGQKLIIADLAAWRVVDEVELREPVMKLQLTPQGGQILILHSSREVVRGITLATGQTSFVLQSEAGPITSAVCSEDGRLVITGHEKGLLEFHDLTAGLRRRVQTRTLSSILSLNLSADGTRAVSGSLDDLLYLWDVEKAMEIPSAVERPPRHADNGMVGGIKTLFAQKKSSAFFSYNSRDLRVRAFNADNGQPSGPFLTHGTSVNHIAQSTDGSLLLTAERDDQISLWHLDRHLPAAARQKVPGPVLAIQFSPDGRTILAAGKTGEFCLMPLPPTDSPPLPEAFLRFAEGFGRWRLSSENVLQQVSYESYESARKEVLALPDDPQDSQRAWLKWLAGDPDERTLWPE